MRLLVAGQLAASTLTITSRFFAARITAEHANDGDDALHLARHDTFDVILLDVSLSGLSGGQFIRRLRDARCNIPVIVLGLSMPGTERARLLDLGADDIIIHPLDGEEVAARVRAVVRRACGHAKSELRWGPLALHLDRRELLVNDTALHLSPNEFRLLQVLLLRKGTLVRKSALLDALYTDPDDSEVKSIDVLMHRLRKRLTAAGADGLITTVWGSGYIVREFAAAPLPAARTPSPLPLPRQLAAALH